MKRELEFNESKAGFRAHLKANGVNFTAGFFIFFFVLALGFTIYALTKIYPSKQLSIEENNIFLAIMLLLAILSAVALMIVINLVGQKQEVRFENNQIFVVKKNPLWFRTQQIIHKDKIEKIKREKLIFSIKNIWYAFLFHDHTAFHEDAEKYLVPHIFNSKHSIAFFEFAEDNNKDFIVEQIRKRMM